MDLKLFFIILLAFEYSFEEPIAKAFKPLVPSETYTHSEFVDEDNKDQYVIFWKLLDNDEIQFELHCKTTGWVGLGISGNGGMKNSDIAIGWFDKSRQKPFLQDCYTTANEPPKVDPEQNWNLLGGAEVDGYTILKYKRKLLTCDKENDKEIKEGSTYMIFAFNDQDPSCSDFNWQYHEKNRWTKSVLLLSYKEDDIDNQNTLPSDTFKIDMRMRNLKIAQKSTYYFCDFYKLPEIEEKVQLIQFEMLVNNANKRLVHHLLAYECNDGFVPPSNGLECGEVNLPGEISGNCQGKLLIAWGIGGQYNYSFPKEAGYPLDLKNKTKYLMIEMHYDNPSLFNDRFDDSGVSLYLTHTLRQHDLGLMWLGVDGSPWSIQIPGQADTITIQDTCHPDCTQRFFPDEGINIVSSLLHTHLAGRSVRTSLVRNGKVIQHLFDNPNYDFNYQFLLDIKPVKAYKGDAFITECSYNTMDRKRFTKFGFSTQDEMCYSFVYYYPKMTYMDRCFSPVNIYEGIRFAKKLMLDSLIPTFDLDVTDPYTTLFKVMNVLENTNTSTKLVKRFKEFYASDYYTTLVCGSPEIDFSEWMIKDALKYYPEGSSIVEKQCDATAYKNINCNGATTLFGSAFVSLTYSISVLFSIMSNLK